MLEELIRNLVTSKNRGATQSYIMDSGDSKDIVDTYADTADVPAYSENVDTPANRVGFRNFLSDVKNPFDNLFGGGGGAAAEEEPQESPPLSLADQGYVQNEAGEWMTPETYEQLYGESPDVGESAISEETVTDEYTNINREMPVDMTDEFLKILEEDILPKTRELGIPDQLVATQAALESGRGTSEAFLKGNNPFGLLWGGKPHYYQTLDNAITDYDRTLRSILAYNKGLVNAKGAMPEFDYSAYTPEDLAWTLMFTDLEDRRAPEGNPLYGDPNAADYRYEAHSDIPDYTALLKALGEWQYFGGDQ